MTTGTGAARPRQVTRACMLAGLGGILVLVSVFATLANWGSIEVREQVEQALAREPLRGAGLRVDDVLGWLRALLMVVGAVAVSTIVFAVFTAQRHRGARTGLTVCAGASSLLFLGAGLTGLLPAVMCVLCLVFLYSAPSRAWFAAAPSASSSGVVEATAPPPHVPPPAPAPPAAARPAPRSAASPTTAAAPSAAPYATAAKATTSPAAPASSGGQTPRRRPRSVHRAVTVTVVMSGVVAVLCGVIAISYAASPDQFVRSVADQPTSDSLLRQLGITARQLARVMFVVTATFTILSLLAIVAALLLLRRLLAGRVLLTVVTAMALVVSIAAFPVGWLWAAGEVFVLVQLYRSDATAWLRAR